MTDPRIQAIQQMQQMQQQATGKASVASGQTPVSFGEMVQQYVSEANDMQVEADDLIRRSIAGEDIEPHTVMLAVEKANITFDLVMEIRNKMLDAYKEVTKTQV